MEIFDYWWRYTLNPILCQVYTAISINVVGSKLQAYATRPNGSVGKSRRLLHVLNTNEV